jgi:hypothetical protein
MAIMTGGPYASMIPGDAIFLGAAQQNSNRSASRPEAFYVRQLTRAPKP